jgi:uncharacterized membrane protein
MENIVLIVAIANLFVGGGVTGSITQVTSSYTIPGFTTVAACEKAKTTEVSRMLKIATQDARGAKVTAECVNYPSK